MLKITSTQLKTLEEVSQSLFIKRVAAHLRKHHSQHLPSSESELEHSIQEWVQDARIQGLREDEPTLKYIESCAVLQGRKEPLATRLSVYLSIHHDSWIQRVDVNSFVATVIDLAAAYHIGQEEGVTWLAVIMLAGHQQPSPDFHWISSVLAKESLGEEARLHRAHEEARRRGWIA